eukprot:SAG11_NODE_408_length_9704_cov_6.496774_1_plen_82_part_00
MKFDDVKRAGSNYILDHIFWNMTTACMARYRVFPKQYIRTVVDVKLFEEPGPGSAANRVYPAHSVLRSVVQNPWVVLNLLV